MNSALPPVERRHILSGAWHWTPRILRILWTLIRVPVLLVLVTFEPFVSLILTTTATVGITTTLLLKFSGDLLHCPFWSMIAIAVSALLLLMGYHVLIYILSGLRPAIPPAQAIPKFRGHSQN